MIALSTLAVAVGYLGTAVAPTLALACAASVIGGVGNGTQWASVETAIHQLVEDRFRARVAAVLEALARSPPASASRSAERSPPRCRRAWPTWRRGGPDRAGGSSGMLRRPPGSRGG